jgi:hypothetical protein
MLEINHEIDGESFTERDAENVHKVREALRLLVNKDEKEGQEALSVIGK